MGETNCPKLGFLLGDTGGGRRGRKGKAHFKGKEQMACEKVFRFPFFGDVFLEREVIKGPFHNSRVSTLEDLNVLKERKVRIKFFLSEPERDQQVYEDKRNRRQSLRGGEKGVEGISY